MEKAEIRKILGPSSEVDEIIEQALIDASEATKEFTGQGEKVSHSLFSTVLLQRLRERAKTL